MWRAIDGVVIRQATVKAEVASLVEVNRRSVGCENVKVDRLAFVLFT